MKPPLKIKTCNIEITKKCNLSCKHCITDSKIQSHRGPSKEDLIRFIEFLHKKDCTSIVLTGGEPLLRKDLPEILRCIKSKNMKLFLHTNGSLINKNNIKDLSKLVSYFVLSLDGAKKETNDSVRCEGAFDITLSKIKLLKKNKAKISIGVTECSKNHQEIKNIIALGKSLGINSFQITKLVHKGRAQKNMEEFKDDYVGYSEKVSEESQSKCTASLKTPFVRHDGEIFPCSELAFNLDSSPFGNISRKFNIDSSTEKEIQSQAKKLTCCYSIKRVENSDQISIITKEKFNCPFKAK